MNRIVLCILVFIMMLSSINFVSAKNYEYKNEETNYIVSIEDDAELLSDAEIDKLASDMIPLTEYGNILFKSVNSNNTSVERFAHDHYYNKFGEASGTLFLIDMSHRKIYIHSDGSNYKTITNSKAEIITDNIYTYASNADYYSCASKAYNQMFTLLEGGKIAEPMRYINNVLIALVSGFLINYIFILFLSKIKSEKSKNIIDNCNVNFQVKNVTAVKTGEHRVYSPQSDSSSGGHSSGGGGHSSHSSGGGGGHSF